MDDIKIGTTIKNDGMTTASVDTDKLIIGTNEINKIALDPNDNSNKSLVTGRALSEAMSVLGDQIEAIDPNNNIFRDNSVVTKTTIINSFTNESDDWEYSNFIFVDGKAHLSSLPNNYLKIRSEFFTRKGTYFVIVSIDRIDSGSIEVSDQYGTVHKVIDTAGYKYFQIDVEELDIQELIFRCKDVRSDDVVIINFITLHFATERIQHFLLYKIAEIGSGSANGYATEDFVNAKIAHIIDLINDIDVSGNGVDPGVMASILAHITDTSGNPHGTDPDKIGAAYKSHNHTKDDIIDFAHTHTSEEIGSAPLNHTHTVEEIGAASDIHSHNEFIVLNNSLNELSERLAATTSQIDSVVDPMLTQDEIDESVAISLQEAINRMITKALIDNGLIM